MTAISFESAEALSAYVTTQVIANADIAAIIERKGRWFLFHF